MIASDFKTSKKGVGIKQAIKALENNTAKVIIVASDADERLVRPVLDLCAEKTVPYEMIESMKELGRLCGIQVGAATVVFLKETAAK